MADDFGMGYALGQDSGNNGGMWGGDGIWTILLFAMIFGYGRNGFGGGYGGETSGMVTRSDLCEGFNFNNLENGVRGIQQGICDSTYALNSSILSGFHGVDNAICTLGYQNQQGFNGVERGMSTLGFQTQSGFNTLGAQLASCCCDIDRGIERNTTQGVMNTNAIQQQIASCCCDIEKSNMQSRFDAQQTACTTLQAIDRLGDRIIDYMSQDKMQALRDENQALRLAASQSAQNQYLVGQLRPAPVPAFSVPAPFHFGGWNNGCGCGC